MKNLATLEDTFIDMARELGDLHESVDMEEIDSEHTIAVVALGTWHEPSVGIFGGAVTPWFQTRALLNEYCRKVIVGEITEGELAEYLAEVTE